MATYIKFLGWNEFRLDLSESVRYVIDISHCHYGIGFSKISKPLKFNPNDEIYLARMTKKPNDYAIFGKAKSILFEKDRDTATLNDIKVLSWKERWPYILRLVNTNFIDGTLQECILLSKIIETFGANSFMRSQRRLLEGQTNINARLFLANQSFIELTKESKEWLFTEFANNLNNCGNIPIEFINNLPRPENDF